jgi:hypothetical protein
MLAKQALRNLQTKILVMGILKQGNPCMGTGGGQAAQRKGWRSLVTQVQTWV